MNFFNWNSPWVTFTPLLAFNIFLLSTVLIFRPVYHRLPSLPEVENRYSSKLLNRWMKAYWFWITDPFIRFFVKFGFTPNALTSLGVMVSAVSGLGYTQGYFGIGGWFMIFAATFDMFDGRVARLTNKATASGAYYDSVMDRVSEGLAFMGLVYYFRNNWILWIVLIAFLGSLLVSYTRAKGESSGVSYTGGAMQRPERIVYLGVGSIFAPLFSWFLLRFNPLLTPTNLFLLPLSFVAIMTWVTAFERMFYVMRELDKKG